jgi:hypothetical protein
MKRRRDGASARRRGHAWEREVAAELRKLDHRASTTRACAPDMDAAGLDIVTSLPFAIQCKAGTSIGIIPAFLEACRASTEIFKRTVGPPKMPVAALQHFGSGERLVVMRFSDWLRLIDHSYPKPGAGDFLMPPNTDEADDPTRR